MNERYLEAVKVIKAAILKSQGNAAKYTNKEFLSLYYSIGGYVSDNSREGTWGTGAIEEISARLREELPGLRGFSAGNIKLMRQFFEAWQPVLQVPSALIANVKSIAAAIDLQQTTEAQLEIFGNRLPLATDFNIDDFTGISFTHHMEILHKTKEVAERLFYIQQCARNHWNKYALRERLKQDLYHHQGTMVNNFSITIPDDKQYLRAVQMFKDEYFLDFINTEELDLNDAQDMDERVLENEIINHIRNFIQCLGSGFCFIGNQHRIEVDGEEFFADLLFFQRDLKALVVIELKKGKFKPAYLGQLNFYLSALDEQERKNGENPSIGILLCKEANKSIVELAIRDYTKPLGVATYRTVDELPENLKVLAPIIEEVPRMLDKTEFK
ncbi:MAG: PDDEXK nuclease domain-containing protein [Lachnospiraceae bacterium]|nr:PDDEXK nuclease domain-containing protein [Lachnospiraceae bacterium]